MELIISIFGSFTAIMVAVSAAFLANKNSANLQIRTLKEQHYISYIESLHNLAANSDLPQNMDKYTYFRDKLFVVASEEVVRRILEFEIKGAGKPSEIHDKYLTDIIKAIRKDLKIRDKDFPSIHFKK